MDIDAIVGILFCLGLVVSVILLAKRKKVQWPPVISETIPTTPEPTTEETNSLSDDEDTSVQLELTRILHRGGGLSTTPTPVDINNEQLEKLD